VTIEGVTVMCERSPFNFLAHFIDPCFHTGTKI
jgi:hypothetical protein